MNYITVKLTEDQLWGAMNGLFTLLEFNISEEEKAFYTRIASKLEKSLAKAKNV